MKVPLTPRRFRKWLGKQTIPPELITESKMVVYAVDAIALNKGTPDADKIIPRLQKRVDEFVANLS